MASCLLLNSLIAAHRQKCCLSLLESWGSFLYKRLKAEISKVYFSFSWDAKKSSDKHILGSNKQFLRNLLWWPCRIVHMRLFSQHFIMNNFEHREVEGVVQLASIHRPHSTSLCLCVPISIIGKIIEPILLGCWEG